MRSNVSFGSSVEVYSCAKTATEVSNERSHVPGTRFLSFFIFALTMMPAFSVVSLRLGHVCVSV